MHNEIRVPARSESRGASPRRALALGARGGAFFVAVMILVVAVGGCATVTPGSSSVVVRTQDLLTNSLALYEQVMALHVGHSTEEGQDLYKALEVVRKKFPKAHRALSDALTAYKARKDPTALHVAVGAFFGEVESLAPEGSPFAMGMRLLRLTWDGGAK